VVLRSRVDEHRMDETAFRTQLARAVEVVVRAVAQHVARRLQRLRFQRQAGVHHVRCHIHVRRRHFEPVTGLEPLVRHVLQRSPCIVHVHRVHLHDSRVNVNKVALRAERTGRLRVPWIECGTCDDVSWLMMTRGGAGGGHAVNGAQRHHDEAALTCGVKPQHEPLPFLGGRTAAITATIVGVVSRSRCSHMTLLIGGRRRVQVDSGSRDSERARSIRCARVDEKPGKRNEVRFA